MQTNKTINSYKLMLYYINILQQSNAATNVKCTESVDWHDH